MRTYSRKSLWVSDWCTAVLLGSPILPGGLRSKKPGRVLQKCVNYRSLFHLVKAAWLAWGKCALIAPWSISSVSFTFSEFIISLITAPLSAPYTTDPFISRHLHPHSWRHKTISTHRLILQPLLSWINPSGLTGGVSAQVSRPQQKQEEMCEKYCAFS